MELKWTVIIERNEIKMTIIEKAHELGEMIKASKEMEALFLAEKEQQEDDSAQQLIADFNIKRLNLAYEIILGAEMTALSNGMNFSDSMKIR